MNKDFVLVYGEWRTGTNLLMSMFRSRGYLDLNEFYSEWAEESSQKVEIVNKKLYSILCQQVLTKCTMKVMLPQIEFVTDEINAFFAKRVLVYRRDIFSSIISRVIAANRLNWYRSTYAPEQPQFDNIITQRNFLLAVEDTMFRYREFISSGRHKITLDHVINYEDDLVPFASNNPTDSLPSTNYTVRNLEELKTLFDGKYSVEVQKINEYFDTLRKETNKVDFEQFIN